MLLSLDPCGTSCRWETPLGLFQVVPYVHALEIPVLVESTVKCLGITSQFYQTEKSDATASHTRVQDEPAYCRNRESAYYTHKITLLDENTWDVQPG